jgi:hypothetical protein
MLLAFACAVVAGAATHVWPDACLLRSLPYTIFVALAAFLLAVGVSILLIAATSATKAYNPDELTTSGIFAVALRCVVSPRLSFLNLGTLYRPTNVTVPWCVMLSNSVLLHLPR